MLLLLRAGAGERADTVPMAIAIFAVDIDAHADPHACRDSGADSYTFANGDSNPNGHAYGIPGSNAISDDAALGLDLVAVPKNDLIEGLPV